MSFLKFIKIFFFLLTFLLGAQTTYAKTELVLPQHQVVFSIEQSQSFIPKAFGIEKEQQPNIGFLKEKTTFVAVQCVSANNSVSKVFYFYKNNQLPIIFNVPQKTQ